MAVAANNDITMIRPGQQQMTDFGSISITQAGVRCGNDKSLSEGLGNSSTPQIFIID